MSDIYLIKGETLTAIADAIRSGCSYQGDYTEGDLITPEVMPDAIINSVRNDGYSQGYAEGKEAGGDIDLSQVTVTADKLLKGVTAYNASGELITGTAQSYNSGLQTGYEDGYADGETNTTEYLLRTYAPLLVQAQCIPVEASYVNYETGDAETFYMYEAGYFDDAEFDLDRNYLFRWYDYIDYEVMISGSEATVGFNNDTAFTVQIFVTFEIEGAEAPAIQMVTVEPYSSMSWGYTADSTIGEFIVNIDGLRFYL